MTFSRMGERKMYASSWRALRIVRRFSVSTMSPTFTPALSAGPSGCTSLTTTPQSRDNCKPSAMAGVMV